MDAKSADMASSNNSSDFVRKLYKMLEDPSYETIVRWGENGDSFVVLENEKFTKSILPKHFKHSNFASFVRQLNKYDFHKVRQNNEGDGPTGYGAGAWEFKHPEFKANNKDSLDNIRRKAPAPRKATQAVEEGYPSQQLDLYNTQLMATQQQLQSLQDRYNDLASGHIVLLQQVVTLQKHVKNHESVMQRVMGFLQSVDAQRRSSRVGGGFAMGENNVNQILDDQPASPLQQAAKLLDEFAGEPLSTKELEQKVQEFQHLADYSTPPGESSNSAMQTPQTGPPVPISYGVGNDLDSLVYPVGHNNGIDPINSEHINNIPYALPQSGSLPVEVMPEMLPDGGAATGRKKSLIESVWGATKPRILLVEDDKVCARIGTKFLQAFECGVDTARDGLQAVSKIETQPPFDLILMDIIMPHLDGVSATVCIRDKLPNIPIIAMTSNIRADDIDMYFRYGMNDVLPKPFTKEGMLRALEKHLPNFKKNAFQPQFTMPSGFATPTTTQPPLGLTVGQMSAPTSLKDEQSPGKSPATANSWHSPNQPIPPQQQLPNQQIPTQSPLGNAPSKYMQHPLAQAPMIQHAMPQPGMPSQQQQQQQPPMPQTPLNGPSYSMPPHPQQHQLPHPQQQFQSGPLTPGIPGVRGPAPTHRRVMSDMTGGPLQDDHTDKRQRMYGPPSGYQQ